MAGNNSSAGGPAPGATPPAADETAAKAGATQDTPKAGQVEVVFLKAHHWAGVDSHGKPVEKSYQPARTETRQIRARGQKQAKPTAVPLPADRARFDSKTAATLKKLGIAVPASEYKPEVAK